MDSGYSIKECRIRLKQGDEISHDTIIQLYLLWPYPDDRNHLLRLYTHWTKLLYGMNMVVEGSIFAVRLTEADPKCPGVCSDSFCSTNFTINVTNSYTHAKRGQGEEKTPKHAQMFPCSYSPILLRNQISDCLQMNDKQHLEIQPRSQLLKAGGETSSKTGM